MSGKNGTRREKYRRSTLSPSFPSLPSSPPLLHYFILKKLDITNYNVLATEWKDWYEKRAIQRIHTRGEISLKLIPYAIAFVQISI
jgi:hypothetical protein